ncbi:hypothetical protein D6D54_01740 [Spiroplasma poulsonii]|uniref:Uncharacterized protein n=1 Tax=Spiroplasma poulsonii TaxID=2138 RepID=A0A3S0SZQ5_9MOLU|nr:hypothetical protein [Spiroplasma poulsonii]MBW3058089.1 hypothetical protein [Spiroplasma poulsonii]RUP78204.1 hypothetical protein D6D54_01740 [Spiroplasma poulsonii]UNF61399.1 hypothetical protein MNU24_05655 [Spiroplasma poulsonii]
MSTQYIVIIIAVIFFVIPFIVWTITRFRTRVLQHYSAWHKIALIVSYSVCLSIFLILLILAVTVFA